MLSSSTGQVSMFNRSSQRDMTSLPVYTKDGSPRHPSSRSMAGSGAAAATAPQQHASQLLQQMSAGLWTLAAPLAPVAVLCAGIYVTSLEAGPGRPVDRQSCSCNCWDGRWVVAVSEHLQSCTWLSYLFMPGGGSMSYESQGNRTSGYGCWTSQGFQGP